MISRRRFIAGFLSLLIYGIIFLLSSMPPSDLPSGIPDIIPHFVEFALLAFFFIQVFETPQRIQTLIAAFLLALLLALLDEWHQMFTQGRIFSCLDLLYDALGTLAGFFAYLLLTRRAKKRFLT